MVLVELAHDLIEVVEVVEAEFLLPALLLLHDLVVMLQALLVLLHRLHLVEGVAPAVVKPQLYARTFHSSILNIINPHTTTPPFTRTRPTPPHARRHTISGTRVWALVGLSLRLGTVLGSCIE